MRVVMLPPLKLRNKIMRELDFVLQDLESRKDKIQCEILGLFEYGRTPTDGEFLDLIKQCKELDNIEYSLTKVQDLV